MNQLDVQVLTSFTRKLAYAAEKTAAPDMGGLNSFLSGAASQAGEVGRAAMDFGRAPKPRPEAGGSKFDTRTREQIPSKPSFDLDKPLPGGEGAPMSLPTADAAPPTGGEDESLILPPAPAKPLVPNITSKPKPYAGQLPPPKPEPSWLDTIGQFAGNYGDDIAAAGAGGLGAMALARMFNSSKDDEEENSWAPWLAGLGGAGLGYGAWNYGPQLAQALAGMTGMGGGAEAPPAAPAAAPAPAPKAQA